MTVAPAPRVSPGRALARPRPPTRIIADLAVHCLHREVETWPKPGLVSHVDAGSHADMNVHTLRRSAVAIGPYFAELAEAGARGEAMECLRKIGLAAEAGMLVATGGVNTHRGAIFGLGLLCAAAGAQESGRADPTSPLGAVVAQRWGNRILDRTGPHDSHGGKACRRYGVGGARWEAAQGFPSIYEVGLPALRTGEKLAPGDPEAARVHACFALIAVLEDTNLLHRGGRPGLRFAQRAARYFLHGGGVGHPGWRKRGGAIHREFVVRHLSPGGAADLLAMSLFVRACEAAPLV